MFIDTHVHFGKSAGFEMPKETVLTAMEKYDVSAAIVSNSESVEADTSHNLLPTNLQKSQVDTAKETIDFAKDNPGKIYAAIWIKPHTEQPTPEFEYLLKAHPTLVKAIKVHPFYSALQFDDPKVESYIQLAQNLELPVITHSADDDFSCCKRVYNMAKKYPDVRFVMAHLGLGTDNEEAIELCAKQENLFGDTAWVPVEKAIKFIQKCGSEKLMFGSDMPIDGLDTYATNKAGKPSIYVPYFSQLQNMIPSKDFENLMFKSALNFYHF